MKVEDRTKQQQQQFGKVQWEYRTRQMDAESDLSQYGQDGWECFAVVPIPHDPTQCVFHFKRRR